MLTRGSLQIATALLLGTACKDPTVASDGVVRVEVAADALALRNLSGNRVYYLVVERGALALIDWVACGGPRCQSIGPKATLRVPFDQIIGYGPNAGEAVVYWWHAISLDGENWRIDSVRQLVVPLK